MINILLSTFEPKESWSEKIQDYLIGKKILIIACSFSEETIQNESDWQEAYGRPKGKYYGPLTESFKSFGVREKDLTFVNYFHDSCSQITKLIKSNDVLFFPGGLPDKMVERLEEKQIVNEIRKFPGVIIGFSAGAMIQIQDFHITEDDYYPMYSYHDGLNLIKRFDIEVHYEKGDPAKEAAIQRCLNEKKQVVYGIGDRGAIISKDNHVELLGDVSLFVRKVKTDYTSVHKFVN